VILPLLFTATLGGSATAAIAADRLPPGRYGMVLDTATVQKLPFLGDTRGGSRGWLLIDIESSDDGLRQVMRTCDVIVTGLKGKEGRVDVPRAFIDSIPVNRRAIELGDDAGTGTKAATYTVDLGQNRVGWDPQRAARMPTTEANPAVTDSDGDGLPGATMQLRVPLFGRVDLYVVQHAHISLWGAIEPGAVVRGGVTFHHMEQATIGASHSMFHASPDMRPDPDRSGFVLRPVPADTTCDTVRATMCTLGEGC
jgi:hypothetical protein